MSQAGQTITNRILAAKHSLAVYTRDDDITGLPLPMVCPFLWKLVESTESLNPAHMFLIEEASIDGTIG